MLSAIVSDRNCVVKNRSLMVQTPFPYCVMRLPPVNRISITVVLKRTFKSRQKKSRGCRCLTTYNNTSRIKLFLYFRFDYALLPLHSRLVINHYNILVLGLPVRRCLRFSLLRVTFRPIAFRSLAIAPIHRVPDVPGVLFFLLLLLLHFYFFFFIFYSCNVS